MSEVAEYIKNYHWPELDRIPAQPNGTTVSEDDKRYPTGGFKSFGHFAWSIAKGGRRGGGGNGDATMALKSWHDLQRKTADGNFEESDPDGGVLVPPQFSLDIYERTYAQNQLLKYLNPVVLTKGRQLSWPALKEDSRVDSSRHGTVLSHWQGEADQYTSQKPQWRKIELLLHKLTVGIYATEELIEDSPRALETYLTPLAAAEINFKINDAVINGTGNGMPLGILHANSRITVAALSGQGASTIIAQNILQMKNRVNPVQRHSMLWLFNGAAEQQLTTMFVATGQYAAANLMYYTPEGELMILGSPALLIEACANLGTEGDLIAFAPGGYACITAGNIYSALSMHLRFDYDESLFKFRFRMDGATKDDVALTPYKGVQTTSSVVTLNSTRT